MTPDEAIAFVVAHQVAVFPPHRAEAPWHVTTMDRERQGFGPTLLGALKDLQRAMAPAAAEDDWTT